MCQVRRRDLHRGADELVLSGLQTITRSLICVHGLAPIGVRSQSSQSNAFLVKEPKN